MTVPHLQLSLEFQLSQNTDIMKSFTKLRVSIYDDVLEAWQKAKNTKGFSDKRENKSVSYSPSTSEKEDGVREGS